MQIIPLYKYEREEGGITVSPMKPDGTYTEMFRIVAEEGMVLVNGDIVTSCTDVESLDGWGEVVGGEDGDEEVSGEELLHMVEEVLGI